MIVTVLCGYENSPYARSLLKALNADGVAGINVVAAAGRPAPRRLKSLWHTHGWAIPLVAVRKMAAQVKKVGSQFRAADPSAPSSLAVETISQGGKFTVVNDINGEECCRLLKQSEVDLLILAGAPIVRAQVLGIPRIGTLNAHQGALPRFRGMNVIEWAIFEGAPPTITIHFVDPGVDTGDIVVEETVPMYPRDTVSAVRDRASTQQLRLLVWTVRAAKREALPRRSQRPEDGQQYFSMHPKLREVAEDRLQRQILKESLRH